MNLNQDNNNFEMKKISKISTFDSVSKEEQEKRNEILATGLLTLHTYKNLSEKKYDLNEAIKSAMDEVGKNHNLVSYLTSYSMRDILTVSRAAIGRCKEVIKAGSIDFLNLGNNISLSRGM